MGVSLDSKGRMQILRDANGKIAWYNSCALLHAEFLKLLLSKPTDYANCDFFAINGKNYQHDKLLISLYENKDVSGITRDMLIVFDAVSLDFHKKANIGMFMPIQFNLDRLYEKVKKDPTFLFDAAKRAKDLVLNETKSCTSCGTLCHVPDVEDIPHITAAQMAEVKRMSEGNRLFCFDCGRIFMTNTAEYKISDCTEAHKVNAVKALSSEISKMDFYNPSFDFNKAQNLLKDMMTHISKKSSITSVDNDKVSTATNDQSKPKVNFINPANTNSKPWLN